jgi:hypothetical protein
VLTEALVTQLEFQKGKDAEIAWIEAQIVVRNKQLAASAACEAMDVDQVEINGVDENCILTMEPLENDYHLSYLQIYRHCHLVLCSQKKTFLLSKNFIF